MKLRQCFAHRERWKRS